MLGAESKEAWSLTTGDTQNCETLIELRTVWYVLSQGGACHYGDLERILNRIGEVQRAEA